MHQLTAFSAFALLATLSAPAHSTEILYSVQGLGIPGIASWGYDINELGEITGVANDGDYYGFIYSQGTVTKIATIDNQPVNFSYGIGINNSGQVTGYGQTADGRRPILYSEGTAVSLGSLGGNQMGVGYAINNLGQVTGLSPNSAGNNRAFIYSDGVMTDIGTLGGDGSWGRDINDNGQVTGGSALIDGTAHAFFYSGGVMTDLGALGGYSIGEAVNASGQVAGHSYLGASIVSDQHAFLYSAGTMTDLGTLGGGDSQALGINDVGQVTGSSETSAGEQHAFVYQGGTMTDLNNLIDPLSEWTLVTATAINNAGQITGIGLVDGRNRAFLLTPIGSAIPQPGTWATMILGFGLAGGALRGSRREMVAA